MADADFEPRIIAFLCNWCTYTGADLAGTSRIQYPPTSAIIRLMCTAPGPGLRPPRPSWKEPTGSSSGDATPGTATTRAGTTRRAAGAILQSILGRMGFDPERVWLRWISASEGAYFAETVTQMVGALKAKGPNPLKVRE